VTNLFERTYENKYTKHIVTGQIDLRKKIVFLEDGLRYTSSEILEHYNIVDTSKMIEEKKYRVQQFYDYDPICGEKRYFRKKVRIK